MGSLGGKIGQHNTNTHRSCRLLVLNRELRNNKKNVLPYFSVSKRASFLMFQKNETSANDLQLQRLPKETCNSLSKYPENVT